MPIQNLHLWFFKCSSCLSHIKWKICIRHIHTERHSARGIMVTSLSTLYSHPCIRSLTLWAVFFLFFPSNLQTTALRTPSWSCASFPLNSHRFCNRLLCFHLLSLATVKSKPLMGRNLPFILLHFLQHLLMLVTCHSAPTKIDGILNIIK